MRAGGTTKDSARREVSRGGRVPPLALRGDLSGRSLIAMNNHSYARLFWVCTVSLGIAGCGGSVESGPRDGSGGPSGRDGAASDAPESDGSTAQDATTTQDGAAPDGSTTRDGSSVDATATDGSIEDSGAPPDAPAVDSGQCIVLPDGGTPPCILCSDDQWHCGTEVLSPCPPGVAINTPCSTVNQSCFGCNAQTGVGFQYSCGMEVGQLRWIEVGGGLSCTP